MKRREFIKMAAGAPFVANGVAQEAPAKTTFEQFLRESAVSREVIDRFLHGPSWAQFDPELGYRLWNYLPSDGMDGSATISTVQANGARTSFMYAGSKCRINAYGDSFTQCHQVSDGETWEEYLAAHLGEPIRNFGMGGYGVYQAYRRMLGKSGPITARSTSFFISGATITSAACCAAATPSPTGSGTTTAAGCSMEISGPTWRWISKPGA